MVGRAGWARGLRASAPNPICLVTLGAEIPPGWQHPAEGGTEEGESRESPAPVLSEGVRLETLLASSANPPSHLYPPQRAQPHRADGETEAGDCDSPWGAGARVLLDGEEEMGHYQLLGYPRLEMPLSRLSSAPGAGVPAWV